MNLEKKLHEINCEVKQLNEGIRFFKDSKRIRKYINKVKKTDLNGELKELIDDLEASAKKFEQSEKLYASGEKFEAVKMHKQLKQSNSKLMKTLNKESIKTALSRLSIGAYVLNAALTIFTGAGLFSRFIGLFSGIGGGGPAMPGPPGVGYVAPDIQAGPNELGFTEFDMGSSGNIGAKEVPQPDSIDLARRRIELSNRNAELRRQLERNSSLMRDSNQYERALREVETQRVSAERAAAQAARAVEAAQASAAARVETEIARANSRAAAAAERLTTAQRNLESDRWRIR